MTPIEIRDIVKERFVAGRHEKDAQKFKAYMKNNFEFYGVRSPERKEIQKEIKPHVKNWNAEEVLQFTELTWKEEEREMQYVGIDMLNYRVRLLDFEHLERIENLITSKSWWDSVDGLAPNIAGSILKKSKDSAIEWLEKWNNSENMWLNRSAIIHQLRYKKEVDLELLFALIESHIGSKEFFINKASGWALRQASKFYPSEIRTFISEHPNLSTLTKREGSKYL